MANRQWSTGREFVILLSVGVPFIFWGLGSFDLLDPDEGLYGSIAREMADRGDWITPHFNGIRYLEKPPLYFWLTALTIFIFDASEWAVRLWSAIPTFGTTILIWRIGHVLYGGGAGLLAAIVFVSGVGVFRYTRVAATDSLLVFSMTLAIYGFVRGALHDTSALKRRTFGSLLFYVGLASGILSKGLIGVAVPLLIVGFYLIFSGERLTPNQMNLKWGSLLFLALTLPWHLLASWTNSGFFEFYVLDNQVLRFLNRRGFVEDDVPVTTIAFLILTLVWFFPWSLFLPAAVKHGFHDPRSTYRPVERLRLLTGLWALTVLGFFSLSSSKLEHYFLPAIPPMSLMVGALWSEALTSAKPVVGLRWNLLVAAAGCSVAGLLLILQSEQLTSKSVFAALAELNVYYRILWDQGLAFPFPSVAPFVPLVKGLGVTLCIGAGLSLLFFRFGRPRASFLSMLGIASVVAVLVFELILIIEPHHSAKSVALALKTQVRSGEHIVHEGSLEYSGSLPFYTRSQILVLNGKRGDLDFGSSDSESQHLFLDNIEFERLWQSPHRVFLVTRFSGTEKHLQGLSNAKFYSVGRYDSRWLYANKPVSVDQ